MASWPVEGKKRKKRWPQTAWLSTSHCFQHFLNISQCFTHRRSDETKEKVKLWLKTAMLVLYLRTLFGWADVNKEHQSWVTFGSVFLLLLLLVSSIFSSKPGEAEGWSYAFIFHQPARDCCHGLESWVCYSTCLCLCVVGFKTFLFLLPSTCQRLQVEWCVSDRVVFASEFRSQSTVTFIPKQTEKYQLDWECWRVWLSKNTC